MLLSKKEEDYFKVNSNDLLEYVLLKKINKSLCVFIFFTQTNRMAFCDWTEQMFIVKKNTLQDSLWVIDKQWHSIVL